MANPNVHSIVINICLILNLAFSLPGPAKVSASLFTTGVKVATDAAAATNSALPSATKAAADLTGKAQETATQAAAAGTNALSAAANAASTAAKVASAGANAVPAAVNTVSAGANAVPAAVNAVSAGANIDPSRVLKLTGAVGSETDAAARGVSATIAGASDSAIRGATDGLTAAGSTAGQLGYGALSLGQNAFSNPFDLFQPQSDLTTQFRTGVNELVNYVDRGTGQLSNGVRAAATGTGGLIDGGFGAIGVQQPIAAPAADAVWRVGESGRNTGFAFLRRGIDGSLYVVDPLVSRPLWLLGNNRPAANTRTSSRY